MDSLVIFLVVSFSRTGWFIPTLWEQVPVGMVIKCMNWRRERPERKLLNDRNSIYIAKDTVKLKTISWLAFRQNISKQLLFSKTYSGAIFLESNLVAEKCCSATQDFAVPKIKPLLWHPTPNYVSTAQQSCYRIECKWHNKSGRQHSGITSYHILCIW